MQGEGICEIVFRQKLVKGVILCCPVAIEGNDMTTNEERIAAVELGFGNEQEWRREILALLDKIEANQRWLVVLLIMILIAIIASNWIG